MCTCDPDGVDPGVCSIADDQQCICEDCFDDGVCTADEDCVCADCTGMSFCNSCDENGICDPYIEDCSCFDCAEHPSCSGFSQFCPVP